MIDARTLLILAAVVELTLAAGLWIGVRQGPAIGAWAGGLAARALAFAVLGLALSLKEGALAVAGASLALAFTLHAHALLRFEQRSLPGWVHPTAIAGVALPLQLLAGEPASAALFGGVAAGLASCGLALFAWHHRGAVGLSPARFVLAGSLAVAGLAFALRGIVLAADPEPLASLATPHGFAAGALLVGAAALFTATLGFVLMHLERAIQQSARLSTLDPLTGACNRRTFHEAAERELARARRSNLPLSLVLLDIDHFRALNEEHGHAVGDAVLAQVAHAVRAALRQEDMLVRFGGDELLVLLPGVPGPGAVTVAGRIRNNVAAAAIEAEGRGFSVTVSLGVSARLDEGPESVEDLVARAASALALAQERGRNRVVALSLGRANAA